MSDLTHFVTGLSQAVSGYMGKSYESSLDTQKAVTLQNNAEANQEKSTTFDNAQGQITPDFANALAPGFELGKPLETFKQTNGRYPNAREFSEVLKAHPKTAALASDHGLSVPAYLSILKNTPGVDQNTVANLAQDFQKQGVSQVPVGLAEAHLKSLVKDDSGISDATLNTLLQGDEQFNNLPTVQDKMGYIQDVKSAMKEPGKAAIKDQDLDKVLQGATATYQAALKNPKQYPNPVAATAAELSKRYNKASVNRVLLKLAGAQVDGQSKGPQQQPQQQGGGLLSMLGLGGSNNPQ